MKPKEFDELVRQKFDQNDFAYNSRNWDRLAEQLDGRAKKRSVIMWWVMPLAGVAASVALAMGVISVLQHTENGLSGSKTSYQQVRRGEPNSVQHTNEAPNTIQNNSFAATEEKGQYVRHAVNSKPKTNNARAIQNDENDGFAIRLENAIGRGTTNQKKDINLLNAPVANAGTRKADQKVVANQGLNTFKPMEDAVKPVPKLSVILMGGISQGNQNNGYLAGASIRKMINDRVYIEGDLAFVSSSASTSTLEEVISPVSVQPAGKSGSYPSSAAASSAMTSMSSSAPVGLQRSSVNDVSRDAAPAMAAKGASQRPAAKGTGNPEPGIQTVVTPVTYREVNQSYNLYYAQVAPSLGVKIIKNLSVGVGPDFQQMLVDNRPAPSTVDKNNVAVDPLFDMGFIGKTEYSVTRNIKAAVSYRKGVNNILTPMDKFIDRDYLQLQLKCAIFNK